jgi:predicted RNA-binding protein with PIN domain
MSTSYIIDGYNLLHAMGAIKGKLGPGGLEQARTRLLGLLTGSFRDKASAVTVVFDASGAPPGAEATQHHGPLTVRFAVGVEQADDLIEDLIRHHSSPKTLIVVSDDHRLQIAARHRGAAAWDTATFLTSLEDNRRQRIQPTAPEKPSSELEKEVWLKEFEDLESDPKLREFFENF